MTTSRAVAVVELAANDQAVFSQRVNECAGGLEIRRTRCRLIVQSRVMPQHLPAALDAPGPRSGGLNGLRPVASSTSMA